MTSPTPRKGVPIVGGIPTARATRADLVDLMMADFWRRERGEMKSPRVVVSSNGAVITAFHRDEEFRRSMLQADIIDADGMSLVFASRLRCKLPLRERVATTDFIRDASVAASLHGVRFYFLGGRPGVAAAAADNLQHLHPGLQVVGSHHGYFDRDEEADICREIEGVGTNVLWVGLGSPLQERFAVANRDRLTKLSWIRTCGGMFDHYVDGARRAPAWMQVSGLEWLYRAMREPARLGPRYLITNPLAAFHLATKTYD